MSSFIYKILFDKQKPLYYNSITVLSFLLLPLLFKVAAQLYPLPILNRVSTHLKLYAVLRQKFLGFPQIF